MATKPHVALDVVRELVAEARLHGFYEGMALGLLACLLGWWLVS